jgi:hypothetical protein
MGLPVSELPATASLRSAARRQSSTNRTVRQEGLPWNPQFVFDFLTEQDSLQSSGERLRRRSSRLDIEFRLAACRIFISRPVPPAAPAQVAVHRTAHAFGGDHCISQIYARALHLTPLLGCDMDHQNWGVRIPNHLRTYSLPQRSIINGLALPVKRYVLNTAVPSRQDLHDSDRYPALVMGLVVSLWR